MLILSAGAIFISACSSNDKTRFNIIFVNGTGYTIELLDGAGNYAEFGGSLRFGVSVNEGYASGNMRVLANDEPLEKDADDYYTLNGIVRDTVVSVTGIEKIAETAPDTDTEPNPEPDDTEVPSESDPEVPSEPEPEVPDEPEPEVPDEPEPEIPSEPEPEVPDEPEPEVPDEPEPEVPSEPEPEVPGEPEPEVPSEPEPELPGEPEPEVPSEPEPEVPGEQEPEIPDEPEPEHECGSDCECGNPPEQFRAAVELSGDEPGTVTVYYNKAAVTGEDYGFVVTYFGTGSVMKVEFSVDGGWFIELEASGITEGVYAYTITALEVTGDIEIRVTLEEIILMSVPLDNHFKPKFVFCAGTTEAKDRSLITEIILEPGKSYDFCLIYSANPNKFVGYLTDEYYLTLTYTLNGEDFSYTLNDEINSVGSDADGNGIFTYDDGTFTINYFAHDAGSVVITLR
jgi:hypothetical protein